MRRRLRATAAAVSFLTRIPVPGSATLDAADVRRSGPYFPLVGAAIGATTGAVANQLPQPLGAAVGFASATLVTGALHLDALADTADGLGARTPEHALVIMRDSSTGAFGVSAIVCDALVKTAALAVLAERGRAVRACVAAGALSRAVPVVLAAALPYARDDGGTGEAITTQDANAGAAAALTAAAVTVTARGSDSPLLMAGALISGALLVRRYRRWLGGVTGDTLGAAAELTETLVLALAVVAAERR